MIIKAAEIHSIHEQAPENGKGMLRLDKIHEKISPKPEKLNMYAIANLEPGGEVGYHKHEGESESYYIISGKALYNDDGIETELSAGDATFTPNGHSHGIKNIGSDTLVFVALIIKD